MIECEKPCFLLDHMITNQSKMENCANDAMMVIGCKYVYMVEKTTLLFRKSRRNNKENTQTELADENKNVQRNLVQKIKQVA